MVPIPVLLLIIRKMKLVFSFFMLSAVAVVVLFGDNNQHNTRMLELSDFKPVIDIVTAPIRWMYSLVEFVKRKYNGQINAPSSSENTTDTDNGTSENNEKISEPKPTSPHLPPSNINHADSPHIPVHHKPEVSSATEPERPSHEPKRPDYHEPAPPPHHGPLNPTVSPYVPGNIGDGPYRPGGEHEPIQPPHHRPDKGHHDDWINLPVYHEPAPPPHHPGGPVHTPDNINNGGDGMNRPGEHRPVTPPHHGPFHPPAYPFAPKYDFPEPDLPVHPRPHPRPSFPEIPPQMPNIDDGRHDARPHIPPINNMPAAPPNWPFLPPSYWNQPIVLPGGVEVPRPPLMAMPEPNNNNNNVNEIPSWVPMPVPNNLPPEYEPVIPPNLPHHPPPPPPPPPPPFGQHPPHVPPTYPGHNPPLHPLHNTIPKEFIVDDDERCGKKTYRQNAVRTRIIGGDVADPHSWPWQIYLQVFHEATIFSCGGSLIRVHKHIDESDIVLTAAHCFTFDHNGYPIYRRAAQLRIWAGRHTLHEPFEGGQQVRSVVDLLMYPTFNPVSLRHDIGLVKLDIPIKFNTTIQPVCRPVQDADLPSGGCFITGWGRTQRNNPQITSPVLKQLRVRVHLDTTCQENDHGGWHKEPVPNWSEVTYVAGEHICAGQLQNPTESTCQGDSGGPLVCYVGDKWVQYGIVSFGPPNCIFRGKPTVYSRVSFFADWITSNAYNLTSVGKRHPLGTHHNGYQIPILRV